MRIGELRPRLWHELRDRARRVRANFGLAVQTGLAAGLAWAVSIHFIGNPEPFFAPIAAVGTLAVSVGQRLLRTVELVIGVALGIAIGDALILWIGEGSFQLGLVVALAIIAAIFLGGGAGLVTQAASSAVLVATLAPPSGGVYYTRFLDALVGGLIGLAVISVLLPLNPVRVVERAANPALDVLAGTLTAASEALSHRNADQARDALQRLREAEEGLDRLGEAIEAGSESATVAPARWRARGALAQYVEAGEYIARALRNARVLVRRVLSVLTDDEPVPASLSVAVKALADASARLRRDLAHGRTPEGARERALNAVHEAGRAYEEGVGFSGSVVVAQIRSAGTDFVRASGVHQPDADRLVRRAFGKGHAPEDKR